MSQRPKEDNNSKSENSVIFIRFLTPSYNAEDRFSFYTRILFHMKKNASHSDNGWSSPPEGLKNFKSHVLQRTALWRQRSELVSVLKGMSGSVKYWRPSKSDLTSSIWNDFVISELKKNTGNTDFFFKSSAQPASLPREHQRSMLSKVSSGILTTCFILFYRKSSTVLQVIHGALWAIQDSSSHLLSAPAPPQQIEGGLFSGHVISHLLL